MSINETIRSTRLAIAVDKLAPKFRLRTFSSNTTALAQQNNRTVPGQNSLPINTTNQDVLFGNILERFVNVSTNVEQTKDFSVAVLNVLGADPINNIRFGKLMTMIA